MGFERASAGEPLLHTKLFAPARHGIWVPRTRLLKRLEDGIAFGHKLLLISAPPGFGKTTLVTEWLAPPQTVRAAWYALDEGDNDAARFMAYFYAALEPLCSSRAEWQELRALFHVSPPPTLDTLLTAALNLLQSENARTPRILVLEDYHVIQNAELHRALAFWLDHAPPGLHLVVTSRADPPLPLSRMRARMQLTEIRAADLRFTAEEAAAFLRTAMGLQLNAEQIATLEQKTEGWIAGLQLAALSLQKDANADAMLNAFTGTHRYIMDYLVEEVLQHEPQPVQTFLLRTSLLERFNAPLCDAVSPTESGASVQLDYLERRNLFIVPLDDRREWYRFHHLFAEVLRHRLRRLHPALAATLYERACEWFAAQELYPEAIQYALAGHAYDRAAQLVQANAEAVLQQGAHTTLLRWLDVLPAPVLDAYPALWLSRAEAFVVSHQLDAAQDALEHFENVRAHITDAPRARMLSGFSAAIGVKIALNRNDAARTLHLGQQALDTLDLQRWRTRASVLLHMGVAYDWLGQLDRAVECFGESRRVSEQAQDLAGTLLAIANLGAAEKTRAQYRRAAAIFQQGMQLGATDNAIYLPAAIYLYTDLSEVLYEWNDLQGARPLIDQALERSELMGLVRARVTAHRLDARWQYAQGKTEQALQAIAHAARLAQTHNIPPHYASPAYALQVVLWLDSGELARAQAWAQSCGLVANDKFDKPRQEEYLALARVDLARNEPTRAQAILEHLIADAEWGGRTEGVIWGSALLALAHDAQNDSARAYAALTRALELAEPQGFVRTFLDLGAPMLKLLQQCVRATPHARVPARQNYLAALLAYAYPTRASDQATAAPPRPAASEMVEPLTERETQVLHLVAQGLSDKQIANQLIVATGTVKRHLNNIYTKLGVNSRTQALARARQVGWIP
jgi:LuxR family maltose regulon positive regulatory protein